MVPVIYQSNRLFPGGCQQGEAAGSPFRVQKNAGEVAEILGLDRAAGTKLAVLSALNTKIIRVVEIRGLTHAQVASVNGISRPRVTAMMNRNTKDISTDPMLHRTGRARARKEAIGAPRARLIW